MRFSLVKEKSVGEKDLVFDIEGFNFMIDEDLYNSFKRFTIEYESEGLSKGFYIKGYP